MGLNKYIKSKSDNFSLCRGAIRNHEPTKGFGFKPTPIVEGFILVVDTREQVPLFEDVRTLPKGLVIVRDTLPIGDYSIRGYEEEVCIERKQQSDWESFIGREYESKTKAKLIKMSDMVFSSLIIEAREEDLYTPLGALSIEVIRGQMVSIRTHFGIHIYINDNRDLNRMYVLDHLTRVFKYMNHIT